MLIWEAFPDEICKNNYVSKFYKAGVGSVFKIIFYNASKLQNSQQWISTRTRKHYAYTMQLG